MNLFKIGAVFKNKKEFFHLIIFCFVASFISGFVFVDMTKTVFAATAEELRKEVDGLSEQISSLDREIANFNKTIKSSQGEQKSLKSAIVSLENKRSLLLKEIDRTQIKIRQANLSIEQTKDRISGTENKIALGSNAISEVLRGMVFSEQSLPPLVGALSKERTMSDVMYEVKQSEEAGTAMKARVSVLKSTKEQLVDAKEAYQEHKEQLVALTDELKDKKYSVDQSQKEKDKLLADTKSKEVEYQKMLKDRRVRKNALEAELLDVEAKLRVAIDASKIPTSGRGVLKYPVSAPVVTQYYGNTEFSTKNSQVYNGKGHNGIDFGMRTGTSILAAQSGTVLGTGNSDAACPGASYGKWILIKHNNGLTTLYAHLSRIDVVAGQKVGVSEKIGLSGNTGYSTGPHLHFTVYASDAVHIAGPTEYRSRACGTYMIIPLSPPAGYLNPLSFL